MSMLEEPPVLEDWLSQGWKAWFGKVRIRGGAIGHNGTTANRPTSDLYVGRPFFDTTLGKPVWYDGTNWVDATGATV